MLLSLVLFLVLAVVAKDLPGRVFLLSSHEVLRRDLVSRGDEPTGTCPVPLPDDIEEPAEPPPRSPMPSQEEMRRVLRVHLCPEES